MIKLKNYDTNINANNEVNRVTSSFNTSNELYGMKKHAMKLLAKVWRM